MKKDRGNFFFSFPKISEKEKKKVLEEEKRRENFPEVTRAHERERERERDWRHWRERRERRGFLGSFRFETSTQINPQPLVSMDTLQSMFPGVEYEVCCSGVNFFFFFLYNSTIRACLALALFVFRRQNQRLMALSLLSCSLLSFLPVFFRLSKSFSSHRRVTWRGR